MSCELDLTLLANNLHKIEENPISAEALVTVNPYLLELIKPMLERDEYPQMREIDFDQFTSDDPPELVRYFQEKDERAYILQNMNKKICEAPPACVKTRAFL